ncbi:MAG: hypothetical protein HY763_14800 [Planctomycetes bacterium]|nr:hypothetical protein [Planctomycetota bacterium]
MDVCIVAGGLDVGVWAKTSHHFLPTDYLFEAGLAPSWRKRGRTHSLREAQVLKELIECPTKYTVDVPADQWYIEEEHERYHEFAPKVPDPLSAHEVAPSDPNGRDAPIQGPTEVDPDNPRQQAMVGSIGTSGEANDAAGDGKEP